MVKSACWSCATLGESAATSLPVLCVCVLFVFIMCLYLLYRELAFQIYKEYERFSKYFDNIKTSVFFGGISIKKDEEVLKSNCPHIVVGTPGRILALARDKTLNLKHIKHFILDECDKMLEQLGKKTRDTHVVTSVHT